MGRSKLTLDLGGLTFLDRALRAAATAKRIDRRLVVVRPEDAVLVEECARVHPEWSAETLLNPRALEGQSVSVCLGAERLLEEPSCEAAIFSVVDQPFLDGETFDALAASWADGQGEILISSYNGQRGNPVLFSRRFFEELASLTGDVGGRDVIRRHPENVAE